MKNIEQFNIVVGFLLAKFYSRFPCKSNVNSRVYVEELKALQPDFDWQIGRSGLSVVSDTIDFLISEGILSVSDSSSANYLNVCLTLKGMNVLNQVPSSIQSKKTLGEQLADAAKNTESIKTIASVVKPVLDYFTS